MMTSSSASPCRSLRPSVRCWSIPSCKIGRSIDWSGCSIWLTKRSIGPPVGICVLTGMPRSCTNASCVWLMICLRNDITGICWKDFGRCRKAARWRSSRAGATHGFLPLMRTEKAARAQIKIAKRNYEKHFGRSPRGIWLPECGYTPGIDRYLADADLRFFFLDSHGLIYGKPHPRYGVFAPVYAPARIAAFGRDIESSRQVWSREEGYPGDFEYREFYRDVGYDAPYDYIRPYLHSDGVRRNVGLKYHRITGAQIDLADKEPYRPDIALERAAMHAGNFMFNRQQQSRHLSGLLGRPPIIVAPYDAELFGHWWYEGPDFVEYLARKIHWDQDEIAMITPSEYLERNKALQVIEPAASSWGDKGYNEVWLNSSNDWIYRHLHLAEDRMIQMAQRNPSASGICKRALNQAARELSLAQSSDWAFIMTTGTVTSYAVRRTREHIYRFTQLYEQVMSGNIHAPSLTDMEHRDSIFQEIDYSVYA
ncbi:MAG: 1,4-alpha-glucan branching protein domain-containing protein [bacterium]